MHTDQPARATTVTVKSRPDSYAAVQPRRAIDCGAQDDRPGRPPRVVRAERGDARHAWITSRGVYADQGQAI